MSKQEKQHIVQRNGVWYGDVESHLGCNGCVAFDDDSDESMDLCLSLGECSGRVWKKIEIVKKPAIHVGQIVMFNRSATNDYGAFLQFDWLDIQNAHWGHDFPVCVTGIGGRTIGVEDPVTGVEQGVEITQLYGFGA